MLFYDLDVSKYSILLDKIHKNAIICQPCKSFFCGVVAMVGQLNHAIISPMLPLLFYNLIGVRVQLDGDESPAGYNNFD